MEKSHKKRRPNRRYGRLNHIINSKSPDFQAVFVAWKKTPVFFAPLSGTLPYARFAFYQVQAAQNNGKPVQDPLFRSRKGAREREISLLSWRSDEPLHMTFARLSCNRAGCFRNGYVNFFSLPVSGRPSSKQGERQMKGGNGAIGG